MVLLLSHKISYLLNKRGETPLFRVELFFKTSHDIIKKCNKNSHFNI